MKATENYFPVILFIMMYKVVIAFESVDEILKCDQMKATEQCVPVVQFITLYWVVLSFGSVGEILMLYFFLVQSQFLLFFHFFFVKLYTRQPTGKSNQVECP